MKMKKRRLKPFVKITLLGVLLLVCVISAGVLINNNNTQLVSKSDDDFTYVNDYIFDSYYPVVNQDEKIIRPYTASNISIYKNFYEKDASEE